MKENRFKFKKLLIWKKALDFGEDVNLLSDSFPKKEICNLSSQIMRAVDSIALNISEESIGQSNPEFKKFISLFYSLFGRSSYLFTQSEQKKIHI